MPRKTTVEFPDGTKKEVEIMESVMDNETGNIVFLNDLRNAEFEVYSKIGPSYSSQKEQTIDRLGKMIAGMDPGDPIRKAMILKQLVLMDGVNFDDIRDYANMQLVLTGIKDAETDEEKQMLEASKQNAQEPDAGMVLAKAEELKGKADMLEEKRKGIEMQLNDTNEKSKQQIDAFEAQTDRMKVEVAAHVAGATIKKTDVETAGAQLDNTAKVLELRQPSVEQSETEMTDDELYQQLMTG